MNIEPKKKAIIIEDFKLISDIWKFTLEKEGFHVIKVFDHAENIENEILLDRPDIILMDINLRGEKTGLDLTLSLLERDPSLRILMLTIHNEPSYIQKAINAGVSGYLTKNASIIQLKNAIQTITNGGNYFINDNNGNTSTMSK